MCLGSMEEQRKLHLLNWEVLCTTKEEGGVEIQKSNKMNQALLARLSWRLLNDQEALWSHMMKNIKHGGGRKGVNISKPRHGASHIWKGIINSSRPLKEARWRVTNGRKIRFWVDSWIEDKPLKLTARG